MTRYRVFFKPSADRQLRKLPDALQRRIVAEVEMLARNPRPRGVVKMAGWAISGEFELATIAWCTKSTMTG